MYFELFMLDNLLMNLLIVRLAAALLAVRPPLYRQAIAALLAAGYAAAAAYLWPVLLRVWLRPIPLALMTLALPFTKPRGALICAGAVLLASFAAGGAAVCAALLTGGRVSGGFIGAGIPLRAALAGAFAASLLPGAFRRLAAKRGGEHAKLEVTHRGVTRSFIALVDTGNRLCAPVSGLPVAVVRCRVLAQYADIAMPVDTAAGRGELLAFRPDSARVNGMPVACLIASADAKMRCEALIPPALIPKTQ